MDTYALPVTFVRKSYFPVIVRNRYCYGCRGRQRWEIGDG